MAKQSEQAEEASLSRSGNRKEAGGRFQTIRQIRMDFEDGSAVIAPAGEAVVDEAAVAITVGDIVDVACKLFPRLCGTKDPGGGGSKPGCYVIKGPDGTTITICPPGQGGIA